ncbi:MAG: VWA domain-containing protein, partial [Prosthecobacter sp.]|nr:VWA domain-containing protein [Prosthecobacter sp.]
SMNYRGQKGIWKFDYARKLAAALAYLLMSQQDAVGLITFDTKVREFIPNRTRITHLHHLLETMIATQPGKETSLAPVLESLAQRLKRRGLVILISDFLTTLPTS